MSTGKPPPRSAASFDKAALDDGSAKLARGLRELRAFEVANLKDRADSRLELLQRKSNTLLGEVFGIGSPAYKKHSVARLDAFVDRTFGDHYSLDEFREAIQQGVDAAVGQLEAARKMLADQAGHGGGAATAQPPAPAPTFAPTPAPTAAPTAAPTPPPTRAPAPPPPAMPAPTTMNKPHTPHSPAPQAEAGGRIVVLGDSDTAVEAIEFLGNMGLEAAVLETPSVDKLDALRDAGFAVVLPPEGGDDSAMLLAVGFLLAVVGRSRICLLATADAQLPAALDGATRIAPDDTGVWRLLLAREMKRAGLEVDLNRAL